MTIHFCDNEKCNLYKVESEARTHKAFIYERNSEKMVIYTREAIGYVREGEYSERHLCDVCANVCKMFEPDLNQ